MVDISLIESEKPTPIFDVVRVVFKDTLGKILLVKEADDDNWKLPGGKIHENETVLQALHRELKEELGISLDNSDILSWVKANIPDSIYYRHVFLIDFKKYEIQKTTEVASWKFYDINVLPDTKFIGHITSAVALLQKDADK